MALDLFANNERNSNNTVFYRTVSPSPYTVTLRLSDQSLPNQNFGSTYFVEYTTSANRTRRELTPTNGFFILSESVSRSAPTTYSWNFNVSNLEDKMFVGSFNLSCVFVASLPYANFLAFPSLVLNLTGTPISQEINYANYNTVSKGVYFYGEGHTETISLCSTLVDTSLTPKWIVGNTLQDILTAGKTASRLPVTEIDLAKATVPITTTIGEYPSHVIALWATNTTITTSGPFITYLDATGAPSYYPFFTATMSADFVTKVSTKLKNNIEVFKYPEKDVSTITSPFESTGFLLPTNYKSKTFTGKSLSQKATEFNAALKYNFAGTRWELSNSSRIGDWSIATQFLTGVQAYKFKLAYEENTAIAELPAFKASPIFPNTVTLNVSSYKELAINQSPYDWQQKTVCATTPLTATINPLPFDKIFTPNYFNLKGTDVFFSIVSVPDYPFAIDKITFKSSSSKQTLVLQSNNTTGSMNFDTIGVVDLSADYVLRNIETDTLTDSSLVIQDIIEIVPSLDETADEEYFHSEDTPLTLMYKDLPRLTPNEWATADNVNYIIEKIHAATNELGSYSKLYVRKDKFYGYLAPAQKRSILAEQTGPEEPAPLGVWQDYDCTFGLITDETASWAAFEIGPNSFTSTWEYQNCGSKTVKQIDPSCYQKYCIQWTWRWRKRGASTIDVTWSDTKSKTSAKPGKLPKKWAWEVCTIDAEPLNCQRANWNIITTDYKKFPIPDSIPIDRCAIIDAEVNIQTDQIILAHSTEIHLVDKDYYCNHRARTGMADSLFAFQNIVAVTTNAESKVIVLDSILPRVCVYSISENDFVPFSSWGGYGLKDNPTGFNQPRDLHIDVNNSIFVADSGNNCIKKFTLTGKPLMTITHEKLDQSTVLSVCVDSQSNVHCLLTDRIVVFNSQGEYLFEYILHPDAVGAKKINVSFNKEVIYVAYRYGVVKYFRNGTFFQFLMKDMVCGDGYVFEGYNSVSQDKFRNVFVTAGDKILQISDIQYTVDLKAPIPTNLYWKVEDLLVHKEEYIQPWVYLKSFHRLWDNIELLRNSLFYVKDNKCKSFTNPTYAKTDLIIGQNEIVTNAVINRLAEQLWTNLQSLVKYFDPDCEN